MSASEALIAKNLHFNAIKTLAEQFGGRIVDVGENDCIVQLTAKSLRVNAFLNLMRTFGVLEAARSGESAFFLQLVFKTDIRCYGPPSKSHPQPRRRGGIGRKDRGRRQSSSPWIGCFACKHIVTTQKYAYIHVNRSEVVSLMTKAQSQTLETSQR